LQPDQWRASDLEGLGVYSSNNGDKIGDISELIFDNSGKVQVVVIGLAGIWELANTALQCRSTRSGSSTSRASTPPAQRRARLDWREPAPEAAPSPHHQQQEQRQCQQAPTVLPPRIWLRTTHLPLSHQNLRVWDKRRLQRAAPLPIMPFS
jgi:hypothetical protein